MRSKKPLEVSVEELESEIFGAAPTEEAEGSKRGRKPATAEERLQSCRRRLVVSIITDVNDETLKSVRSDTKCGLFSNKEFCKMLDVLVSTYPSIFQPILREVEMFPERYQLKPQWNIIVNYPDVTLQARVPNWKPDTVLIGKVLKPEAADLIRRRAKGGTEFWVSATYVVRNHV